MLDSDPPLQHDEIGKPSHMGDPLGDDPPVERGIDASHAGRYRHQPGVGEYASPVGRLPRPTLADGAMPLRLRLAVCCGAAGCRDNDLRFAYHLRSQVFRG